MCRTPIRGMAADLKSCMFIAFSLSDLSLRSDHSPTDLSCVRACACAVRSRMKVVASIQKITKAMKMVSAAKLNGLQRNLATVRDFSAPLTETWKLPAINGPFGSRALCVITSDRGLCGSMNSALNRQAKRMLLEANIQKKTSPPYALIPLGNKGKNGNHLSFQRFSRALHPSFSTHTNSECARVCVCCYDRIGSCVWSFLHVASQ